MNFFKKLKTIILSDDYYKREEDYLAQSTSLEDLERRQRALQMGSSSHKFTFNGSK